MGQRKSYGYERSTQKDLRQRPGSYQKSQRQGRADEPQFICDRIRCVCLKNRFFSYETHFPIMKEIRI